MKNCTDKEKEECECEKLGCDGCYYNDKEEKNGNPESENIRG